ALGSALAARGHAVDVFAAAKDISAPDLSLRRRELRGVRVHEVVNNLFHTDFRATWDHAGVDARFEEVLAGTAPEVVHFQHLMYLSSGCVAAARRRGSRVLFTLHDFWLQCPRFGQRLHPDGERCERIAFSRCGTCLPSFKWAQTPVQRRVGSALAAVRARTGIDLGPIARSA